MNRLSIEELNRMMKVLDNCEILIEALKEAFEGLIGE